MIFILPDIKIDDYIKIFYNNHETGKTSEIIGTVKSIKQNKIKKVAKIILYLLLDRQKSVEMTFFLPNPAITRVEIINQKYNKK